MFENELFGHEGGAYTNASAAQEGLVRAAEGGTLFLDEIDAAPLGVQVKLLRLIQAREYRPLGTPYARRADVLIIAASNADLEAMMRSGKFRQDLFCRIAVFTVNVPPLRERRIDIPLLARHFLDKYRMRHDAPKTLAQGAVRALTLHAWPGNVRELENLMQRMVIEAEGEVISENELGLPSPERRSHCQSFRVAKDRNEREFERSYVEQVLLRCNGNITEAARMAQMARKTLQRLLKKLEIGSICFEGVH